MMNHHNRFNSGHGIDDDYDVENENGGGTAFDSEQQQGAVYEPYQNTMVTSSSVSLPSSRRRNNSTSPHTPYGTGSVGVVNVGEGGGGYNEYEDDAYDPRQRQHRQPIHIYHSSHEGSRMKRWLHVGTPMIMIISLIVITITLTIVFNATYVIVEQSLKVNKAAIATDSPLCSNVGKNVMKNLGGNAVDAAIAAALCLGVVRPQASGIGGGGFMTIHMAKHASLPAGQKINDFINFREKAPGKSSPNMFKDRYEKSVAGGLSVAVPGEIAGLWEAHQTYGSISWASLFKDAISLARNGFVVDDLLALRLQQSKDTIMKSETLRKIFTKSTAGGGVTLLAKGDLLKRTEYANTLERIANNGVSAFYEGPIAQALIKQIQADGGIMTLDDLRNFNVERIQKNPGLITMENVTSDYQEFKVVTGPPPSSGVLINFMLNILNNFDLDVPLDTFDYAQKYHYILESLKFGFTHRMALGDRMSPQNVSFVLGDHILNAKYAEYLADFKIQSQTTHPWEHYIFDGYTAEVNDHGTSHISVIDADRNVVSLTTTINHSFGSKLYNLETGIVLNNQMNDFTVDMHKKNEFGMLPTTANIIEPGKRPQSSMAPTILLDKNGNAKMAIGASGGPTILSSIIQVIVSIQDFHLDTYNAVNMPRFHAQPPSQPVKMEAGIVRVILEGLKSRGHEFELSTVLADGHAIGNVQVVKVTKDNTLEAASDSRKQGRAAGY